MTTYGTSYFTSRAMAVRYYRPYAEENTLKAAAALVDRKLAEGEIHIGVPHLKAGEMLSIIDNGTRYAITEATDKALSEYQENVATDIIDAILAKRGNV